MSETSRITTGNANIDGKDNRGWFIGSFISPDKGNLHTKDVEIKWSEFEAGYFRESTVYDENVTTLVILIDGTGYRLNLDGQEVQLNEVGDYVVWNPNIPHTTSAVNSCKLMVVRWPSLKR